MKSGMGSLLGNEKRPVARGLDQIQFFFSRRAIASNTLDLRLAHAR